MKLSLPTKLVILHSALIMLFMFTLWNRWFLTDIPFDCFYAPFFVTSGPLVYSIAHYAQHWSEQFFSAEASVFLPWDVVPGIVCLILGGIQWWFIGRLWLWFRKKEVISNRSPWHTKGLTNRRSQPLAVMKSRFEFMKQFPMFPTLAPASGGSASSR